MVYAFVIHARFVPSLREWIFNLMSMFVFINFVHPLRCFHGRIASVCQWRSYTFIKLDLVPLGAITLFGVISYPKYKKYYKK
jgi:hypothetical protein